MSIIYLNLQYPIAFFKKKNKNIIVFTFTEFVIMKRIGHVLSSIKKNKNDQFFEVKKSYQRFSTDHDIVDVIL